SIAEMSALNSTVNSSLDVAILNEGGTINADVDISTYHLADIDTTFNSSSANVTVVGGTGDDTFVGGSGDDTFSGGSGTDKFTGGLGNDTFQFATSDSDTTSFSTADRITDFTTDVDEIDISVEKGDFVITEATLSYSDFVSAATDSFDGSGADIFAMVAGDYERTFVAVDMDESGTFTADDLLIRLDDVTQISHLQEGDFI
ncbi:hypothetical protein OAP82_09445, partial [Paracoccaceae bacterium]|nr:hypothetical protein [Paracoccaceae bacterium]